MSSRIDQALKAYLDDRNADRVAERAKQQLRNATPLVAVIADNKTPFPFFRKVNEVLEVRVTVSRPANSVF